MGKKQAIWSTWPSICVDYPPMKKSGGSMEPIAVHSAELPPFFISSFFPFFHLLWPVAALLNACRFRYINKKTTTPLLKEDISPTSLKYLQSLQLWVAGGEKIIEGKHPKYHFLQFGGGGFFKEMILGAVVVVIFAAPALLFSGGWGGGAE